ncbi:PREDICTED: uncharacterized protein LOC109313099 isoform X1 [Crocodylus porosus]|uniref:uncharacterized protein LOC109313099 isoform X1 n=1 Tax=Crocodylus porosus TaxID=8502 RepID=UPI00093AD1F5|nr:PREDICTED: uncharacterized protein LOC109313099 isoform X1 [Crocodylus porosus]
MELRLTTPSAPFLTVAPRGLELALVMDIQAYASLPSASLAPLFLLRLSSNISASVTVSADRLYGTLASGRLELSLKHSDIGPFSVEGLQQFMNFCASHILLPLANGEHLAGARGARQAWELGSVKGPAHSQLWSMAQSYREPRSPGRWESSAEAQPACMGLQEEGGSAEASPGRDSGVEANAMERMSRACGLMASRPPLPARGAAEPLGDGSHAGQQGQAARTKPPSPVQPLGELPCPHPKGSGAWGIRFSCPRPRAVTCCVFQTG